MLFDEVLSYLLLFRCPGSSVPLYWGTDADAGDVLLLSTREAPGIAQFPPGCAYEVCLPATSPGKPLQAIPRLQSMARAPEVRERASPDSAGRSLRLSIQI